ncbi:MAG: hypothetical protein R3267_03180 [Paenisporosarcina sp.]|nr:hypothetical protein [Paenisporosarcina sp.]
MTTDERLIIRLCNHESQSLDELYDRYVQLLWNMASRKIADETICEDIVRQVFQNIWENPSAFNNEKKLSILLMECCKAKINQLVMEEAV